MYLVEEIFWCLIKNYISKKKKHEEAIWSLTSTENKDRQVCIYAKFVCVFLILYLTRHGLGPVTGYNLEGDATPHLPLFGQGKKMLHVSF